MTVQEAKKLGKESLTSSPSPELDTAVLLQHVTGLDKTKLLVRRDYVLTEEQEKLFTESLAQRKTGLPVAYITGHKEFYGYDFFVTPDVLIPKPDTEVLIDNALNALAKTYAALQNPDGSLKRIPTALDMCSGSGCVGISILKALMENDGIEVNDLPKMTFADISIKALEITKKNAENLLGEGEKYTNPEELNSALCKVRFVQTNLFDNLPLKYDFIFTNPPYVPHTQSRELLKDGRNEPLLALDGDIDEKGDWSGTEDGLSLIRRLVPECYEHLEKGGLLIMETGEYNAEQTAVLFEECGFKDVRIENDLNDMMRNVIGGKY